MHSNLIYALKNNQIVSIDDVESGLKCDCICPACGNKLIAKKGNRVMHHFAHRSETNCEYGYETSLHLAAKDILSKAKKMMLPPVRMPPQYSHREDSLLQEAKEITIENVFLEKHFQGFIPDIVVCSGGKQLFVEIFVTHRIDEAKKKGISVNISLLEKELGVKVIGMTARDGDGLNDFLRLLPTNILLLDTEERLLNTIAYIDRNPVVSGYRYLTTEYQWGSARYVFKNSRKEIDVKPLSTLSRRCQRSMLGTRVVLPGDWRIDGKGMICPDSFIDASVIESYFKTPARYSYFLSKKLEGVVEHELESSQRTFILDIELREIVRKMVSQDFGKDSITELDVNARLAIARKLRYSYASTLKQISRMVHLDRTALEGFI